MDSLTLDLRVLLGAQVEELKDMAEEMKVLNPSFLSQRNMGKSRETIESEDMEKLVLNSLLNLIVWREEGWYFDFNTLVVVIGTLERRPHIFFWRLSTCGHFLPDIEVVAGDGERKQVASRAEAWDSRKEAIGCGP